MANRRSSDNSSAKHEVAPAAASSMRRWFEGMRLEVLANLAHELRTPLQVLLGYLDIIRDEWAPKFDAEPRSMLERMNSNLHDLSQTVDNILEFVMSEAGGAGRVEEDVSISGLVNDLAPAIDAAKADKQLALKIDIADAPATIHTSRRPLRSILSNLVLNANKVTEQGSVTVRIAGTRSRGSEPGLVLEIADTGMGMSPEAIQRAAEPFARLAEAGTRKYRGLGLGLAVVHRHISALGARFDVTSTPGRGSRFVVRIPPTPIIAQQGTTTVNGRIFGTSRAKHVTPPGPHTSPTAPRKAAGATNERILFD